MKTELDFEVSFKCSVAVSEDGRKTIISTVMGTSPDEFDLDVPEEMFESAPKETKRVW